MLSSVLAQLVLLLLVGLAFRALERRFGRAPRAFFRRERALDFAWWAFNSALAAPVLHALVFLALLVGAFGTGVPLREFPRLLEALRARSPVSALPGPAQLLLGLLLADLGGYWMHRAQHRGRLWRAHAVHHSARSLDWFSAARNHPLSELLGQLAGAVPLVLLGFSVEVFTAVGPLLALYGLLLHTDVPWDFGPLRRVLASPLFHRWHHSAQEEAHDKNFAGLFAFWDVLFGTFYLPAGRRPARFGVDEPLPRTFFAQLWHPFARR